MSRYRYLHIAEKSDAFEILGHLPGDKRFCMQFTGPALAAIGLKPTQAIAVLEMFAGQLDDVLREAGCGHVYSDRPLGGCFNPPSPEPAR